MILIINANTTYTVLHQIRIKFLLRFDYRKNGVRLRLSLGNIKQNNISIHDKQITMCKSFSFKDAHTKKM